MNDWNTCRATQCAPGQPAGLHLALQRCDGFKDQSPKACTLKPGRELPTPKAQTIFVMGVMGYQRHLAAPGATFAMDQARDMAALVTDVELHREIASLSFWDSLAQPHNHQGTTP